MRYFWYGLLGLFSIGFLGLIAGTLGIIYIFSASSKDLPDYRQLKDYEPPIVTRLYAGDGRLLAEFAQEKRVYVPIDSIPERIKQAFIAAEDKNFYHHHGLDYLAIVRAALTNLRNSGSDRNLVGASTITQQAAKNLLLLEERQSEKTITDKFRRKIREAILAYRMDKAMSKERILELYLNEIYLGAGSYGVAAAALNYFDKSLDELTLAETAYLAALPKAPNNYHPVRRHEAAVERRNWVIDRMLENGFIDLAQADLAKMAPLEMAGRLETDVVAAPYFIEEVRRQLAQRYGDKEVYGGGLVVRTTIDPKLQQIAVETLRKGLVDYDRRHGWRGPYAHFDSFEGWRNRLEGLERPGTMLESWRLAMVLESSTEQAKLGFAQGPEGVMELKEVKWARKSTDGGYTLGPEVTAVNQLLKPGDVIMVEAVEGENRYALRQVPEIQGAVIALDPHTGRILALQGGWTYDSSEFNRATQALRQPGSAFKPFVYLAALDHGFTPATLVLDAPFVMEDRPGNVWKPTNYSNDFYGPTPIRVGVEKSRNLMTVRLADYLGMDMISEYAGKFGITDDMPPHLANALGAGETTLLRLSTAYAMLVNGGKQITPTFIDRVQDRRGATVYRHDDRPCPDCGDLIRWEDQEAPVIPDTREPIADPRTAYQMVSILEGVVKRGTAASIASLGRPLAGKTGTTNESKDAWFIGFSPDLVVGVFTGFDEPRSLGKRETGSSVAAPVFKEFMARALADKTPAPFRIPPGIRQVQINADTGARARPGDERVIWEAFVTGTEPTEDTYILDGQGISMMPDGAISAGAETRGESATTGTGGLY